jgi:predicted ester cyclase
VVVQLTMYGEHTGDFFGIASTGREVKVNGTQIIRIAKDKIAEHQGVNDDLGFMRQLGAIPTPTEEQ